MTVREFSQAMDSLLHISEFDGCDVSFNGLQVGNENAQVRRVLFAVDACQASIDAAAEGHYDILFVHHGLFWGSPIAVTGTHYNRIKKLLDSNVSLFACHLPLDAHPELGNNAQIARSLGLKDTKSFCTFHGKDVGVYGTLEKSMTCDEIASVLGLEGTIIRGGKSVVRTAGIVSGSAATEVNEAIGLGLDVYITGESSHVVYHTCMENGINMMCLGHYGTETFGVKAVMEKVRTMGFEASFVDIPTRL